MDAMPALDLFPAALVITGLAGGLLLLAAGIVLCLVEFGRRLAALRAESAAAADALSARLEDVARRVELSVARRDGDRDEALDALAADLAAVRAEVEWLGGERMIDEAVRLCREGVPHGRIGEDLGLSPETVRAISLLRAH
jgi:hypothetical protein